MYELKYEDKDLYW